MAMFEVFSHPELRRYKTSVVSKASILMLAILALTFIPPLLVVYRSYGFWLREASYREQPKVAFKKEFIMVLDLQNSAGGDSIVYSTFQQYNNLLQSKLRIPIIKAREDDLNHDGKYDRLDLNIEVPMLATDQVVGVKLLLFFYYRLRRFSQFHMESLAYIEHSSGVSGSSLQVFSDLSLQQKQLLGHKGTDRRYNGSLVNETQVYADVYSMSTIFRKYSERNVTTYLQDPLKVWSTGRAADAPFRISTLINYPEQQVFYAPGFWYLIKWGWIQYASVLLIFLYIFNKVKVFVFQHQIVATVVAGPSQTHVGIKDKFS
ncbi:hypothetical protein RRG08_026425 [Elysia crispata]|uniref:Transmembrane protein 231 n=1 Tax=Elysia crispata TaxID=231223 RepID=A0AAE0Y443_9GAST|nr:hypothetical protein RRG08_026425 [Elysia crispata]